MSEDTNKKSKDYINEKEFPKKLSTINNSEKIKDENIKNIKKIETKNICLLLILILLTSSIIFICLFFTKINKNIKDNIKDEITCYNGLFLPEDDKTKCIKCSIENCNECTGTKLNNICNKCNPSFYPIYEDNKIVSCSICNEGYYYFNDECKEYSFRAKYKSNGGTIKLINSDISKIKEMIVDGIQVSPSNYRLFNDTQDHEIFMLLDLSKYRNLLSSMFYGINSMISISFSPFFNTSNITNMGFLFYNCYSVTSINLSNFNTSNVKDIQSMFDNCYSLTSINLSNFNTSNVIRMQSMFYNCSSLTSINLSNFNTSKVNDMSYMFYNCSSLTSINLSNFNTSKIINMYTMFYGCTRLIYINILNFSSSGNSYIDLFDQNIPSSGTLITNENFKNKLNISYLREWNISIL